MGPLIDRLQTYLRESAASRYRRFAAPPFSVFIQPDDSLPYFNYAVPDEPDPDPAPALDALRRIFTEHDRLPRFEFLDAYAPTLGSKLEAAGFVAEDAAYLMVCTPTDLRPAPAVAGLEIAAVGPADRARGRQLAAVLHAAFGNPAPEEKPDSHDEPDEPADFGDGGASLVALIDGVVIGGGSVAPPIGGLAEVAGIGTLEAYRRRGVATAITAALTQLAFERDVTLAFLTAGSEAAGRVYATVGYQHAGWARAYREG
jgi:RimJ/RimL family protein N-acetyltransferase